MLNLVVFIFQVFWNNKKHNEVNNMQKVVGLDIHKKHINAVVLDPIGKEIEKEKIPNEPRRFDRFLATIPKNSKIALESCSCWQYIYDYLKDAGFTDVSLANPGKVRLIATSKKKTDFRDAKDLAQLLRVNLLPKSYAPPKDIREQRQISRHRESIGRLIAVVKNKISAILLRHGIVHEFSDVFGVEGINYLRSIDLPMCDRYELDNYLALIRHLSVQAMRTEARIEDYVRHNPFVRIIMTIPGISYYSGLMIVAEIGDIRRFSSIRKLTCFAGLNPSVSQSGDKCYTGHIAKQGDKHLRWILIQCANVAIMHDSLLAKIYHRIKKRRGHNIAITAVARKLLGYIYVMMAHNIPYQALQIHKVHKASSLSKRKAS
jgi:transposase